MTKNYIEKDGVKYYSQKKLEFPRESDFFVATGEVEWGGGYQDTGYIDKVAYEKARQNFNSIPAANCHNRAGYYCKNTRCNFPTCSLEKK